MVSARNHDRGWEEGRQGLRSEVAQRASRRACIECAKREQVPSGSTVLLRSGHWRGLCRFLNFVSALCCILGFMTNLVVLDCCIMKLPPLDLQRSCETYSPGLRLAVSEWGPVFRAVEKGRLAACCSRASISRDFYPISRRQLRCQ